MNRMIVRAKERKRFSNYNAERSMAEGERRATANAPIDTVLG